MRAWSTIVASGPCLMVNLSAERGKQVCPKGNIFAGRGKRELSNRQYLRRRDSQSKRRTVPPIRW
jgi:hypothetical protein